MVNSRNKGAAFERFIVNKINNYFESKNIDKRVKRNLDQYQTKRSGRHLFRQHSYRV